MNFGEHDNHTLLALKRYDEIPSVPSDKIDRIQHIEAGTGIGGPFLIITASYTGGDNDHSFLACWDGSWLKNNPPGLPIVLLHDAHGDAWVEEYEDDEPRTYFTVVCAGK